MKRLYAYFSLLILISPLAHAAERPPNVLFILADDLGYGDLGVLYQNARYGAGKPALSTPNLDALAHSGLLLRHHYCAAPVCAPARASLMTGQTQGHCPIRDNQFDKPLPDGILTVPAVLKHADYYTMAIGKWGIGGKAGSGWPAHPMRCGFDDFFGFMMHKYGHVYYHDEQHPLMNGLNEVGARYENVYSTDLFTARAKKLITEHESAHPDQPFFLYLAYTAVHNALDVPGGPYPAGGGIHGGMHWPLVPTPLTRNTWIHPDYAQQPWTMEMKRYATMVRRLDDGVHDVLQLLDDLHIADKTLVVFTSDNGPANEGGGDPRLFESWGPFDGFKRDCFEGGVREPTIVAWPGHIAPGRTSDLVSAQYDWMPTLADLAHLPPPAHSDGVSLVPTLLNTGRQREHPYVYIEYFHGGKNPASKDVFARKHVTGRGQQQMVRIGDFAGIRTQIKTPDDALRLYNVVTDPREDQDVSADPAHSDLLKRMTELLVTARRPDGDAPRPYDDVPLPAVRVGQAKSGQITMSTFEGDWPWTPDFAVLSRTATAAVKALALPEKLPNHPFGLGFYGYLSVPADGTYTFVGTSDEGLHLWLHDAHMIDVDHCEPGRRVTASVRLRVGLHPLRIAYTHRTGSPTFSLRYSGPNLPEQDIPAAALSSDDPPK
jgi:arylsulfatase A-like enzyme